MYLYYDHTLYSFPLYTFLWPEDGPQWPKHVVSIINRIQDSCVLTYPTHSLIAVNLLVIYIFWIWIMHRIWNISKILSPNLPGGTWETIKTTANTQTAVAAHYSIILHEHLFPDCTTWYPTPHPNYGNSNTFIQLSNYFNMVHHLTKRWKIQHRYQSFNATYLLHGKNKR